jgi:hypothetical protein
MKLFPPRIRILGLVAGGILTSLGRAEDALSFSVPLIIAADEPVQTPQARFSTIHTLASGDDVAVDRYSLALYGFGLPIGQESGVEVAAQADRSNFEQGSTHWQPWNESDIIGTAGLWHQFSEKWVADVAYTRSSLHESSGFNGVSARADFYSYSAGFKFRSDEGWRAFGGFWITPGEKSAHRPGWGPVVGVAGRYGEHWQWLVGYPNTTVGYQFNRRIGLYSGVAWGGDLSNGEGVTGVPNVQNFNSYNEIDLKVGVVWTVFKGWTLDAALAFPLYQKFGITF